MFLSLADPRAALFASSTCCHFPYCLCDLLLQVLLWDGRGQVSYWQDFYAQYFRASNLAGRPKERISLFQGPFAPRHSTVWYFLGCFWPASRSSSSSKTPPIVKTTRYGITQEFGSCWRNATRLATGQFFSPLGSGGCLEMSSSLFCTTTIRKHFGKFISCLTHNPSYGHKILSHLLYNIRCRKTIRLKIHSNRSITIYKISWRHRDLASRVSSLSMLISLILRNQNISKRITFLISLEP